METSKTLIQKLVTVMAAVDHVEKRGRNEKQSYDYVKAADVARECRAALVAQNVLMVSDVEGERTWEKQTNSGGTLHFCSLRVGFTFHDADSGSQLGPLHGYGWGMDTGDKAPYKAMTGALKYALRTTFLIPDESDPENEQSEKPRKAQKTKPETLLTACARCGKDTPKGPVCVDCLAKETVKRAGVESIRESGEDIVDVTVTDIRDWHTKDDKPMWFVTFEKNGKKKEAAVFNAKLSPVLSAAAKKKSSLTVKLEYGKSGRTTLSEVLEINGEQVPFVNQPVA